MRGAEMMCYYDERFDERRGEPMRGEAMRGEGRRVYAPPAHSVTAWASSSGKPSVATPQVFQTFQMCQR